MDRNKRGKIQRCLLTIKIETSVFAGGSDEGKTGRFIGGHSQCVVFLQKIQGGSLLLGRDVKNCHGLSSEDKGSQCGDSYPTGGTET